MGEHLPCKQGVESSNLLVSICKSVDLQKDLSYLENRISKNQVSNVCKNGRKASKREAEFEKQTKIEERHLINKEISNKQQNKHCPYHARYGW